MNILVMGGTRFFGKCLVEQLLQSGHSVTIATRGTTPDPFGDRVGRRILDRKDLSSLAALARSDDHWDAVVDQICYSPNEADIACRAFRDRVGRYVHTSTASVYLTHGNRPESDFDPLSYPLRMGDAGDFDYGEGKRLAEAVFFQRADFPVAAMRIPIVLGPDDYTERMEFHIRRVRESRPIVATNLAAETSFIHSAEAARFLAWLVEGAAVGPFNARSDGEITLGGILSLIEECVGKRARVAATGDEVDFTPFVGAKSKTLDTSRAHEQGFAFDALMDWLPGLVKELCVRPNGARSGVS